MDLQDRFRGALAGLATGDALGTTLEFKTPGSLTPIDDIVGGGPFSLEPGQWTDDTSMALCLAESLLYHRGFNPEDQMRRYVRWWRDGYWSVNGRCFDIGVTISSALARFERSGQPYAGSTNPNSAGNGSLMRLVPVALAWANSPVEAIERAGDSSRTTHGAQTCVDACRYFAGLLIGALQGIEKSQLLRPGAVFHPALDQWPDSELHSDIEYVARGSYLASPESQIKGSGYVVESLEAALWAFARSEDFESGALMAVNLGDDADTTGAIYGQIGGAYYGYSGIPENWLDKIAFRSEIIGLADRLFQLNCELAQ